MVVMVNNSVSSVSTFKRQMFLPALPVTTEKNIEEMEDDRRAQDRDAESHEKREGELCYKSHLPLTKYPSFPTTAPHTRLPCHQPPMPY
jgi:hypothetical protein